LKKRAAGRPFSLLFEIQRDYNLQSMTPGREPNMFVSLSMKKTIPAAGAMLFFLFSQIAWSGSFTGSPHDFRKDPRNSSEEICLPCHMMQSTKTTSRLLWDLDSPVQPYIMYDRTVLPPDGAEINRLPGGMSKNCLSCHDGVIAPEAYGRNTGGHAFSIDRGFTDSTQNNNHPISFIYDTELAMNYEDLYDPSTHLSGVADSSKTNNDPSTALSDNAGTRGTINEDMLFSNRMECSSCHDVHNTIAVPGTKLLVKDSAGSELCLTCHNK
jgi:predicted CXXCH cytochrome family protein